MAAHPIFPSCYMPVDLFDTYMLAYTDHFACYPMTLFSCGEW